MSGTESLAWLVGRSAHAGQPQVPRFMPHLQTCSAVAAPSISITG